MGVTTHESFMKQYNLLPDKRMIFGDLPSCGKSKQKDFNDFSFENAAFEVMKAGECESHNFRFLQIMY